MVKRLVDQRAVWIGLLVLAAMTLAIPEAHASSATGLPWESGLETLRNSVTGPVAFSVSLIGIVVAGCMLIWGGEINQFAKSGAMLALVVALIVGAQNVLSTLFGVSSAVVF
jgi:type IV secretion system protein TrbC